MKLPSAALAAAAACLAVLSPQAAAQEFRDSPFLVFEWEGNLSADVTLADVDRDGDLDVLVANGRHWAQQDWAYLNLGNGRLLEALPIGAGRAASYTIASGDFDGDGDPDLAVVRDSLPVAIYANRGEAGFVMAQAVPGSDGASRGALLGDLDGDGFEDIVVLRRRGADLLIRGKGDGTFVEAVEIDGTGDGTTGGDMVDLDGDGDLDLVLARRDDHETQVLENDGSGVFVVHPLAGSRGDHRKAIARDIDGDGRIDIVLGGSDGSVELFRGIESRRFSSPTTVVAGDLPVQALAAADFDADGALDLVVGREGANLLLRNDGSGAFAVSELPGGEGDTYGVAIGDMNGDAKPDIVIANSESENLVLLAR